VYLGAKRRYINTLPFLFLFTTLSVIFSTLIIVVLEMDFLFRPL